MYQKLLLAFSALTTLPFLAACSGTGGDDVSMLHFQDEQGMPAPTDPSDAVLFASIQEYLSGRAGPANSQYQYVRADLNGDGLREGLVLFNLPHSYWCGWGGCTMAIFQAEDNQFALLSETSKIRGPVFIGETKSNGWAEIGVRLTGTSHADYNVMLQFDGYKYPDNPMDQATVPYDLASLGGMRVFP